MTFQLKHSLKSLVLVKLNDKSTVSGILLQYDNFMNLVVSKAVIQQDNVKRSLGLTILKGDNIQYIIPSKIKESQEQESIQPTPQEPIQKSIPGLNIPGLKGLPGFNLKKMM